MPHRTPGTSRSQRLHRTRKPRTGRRNATSVASTSTTDAHLEDVVPQMSEHQCCGVVEEAAFRAQEKKANRTAPQPWVTRKIAVVITLGIMGYAGYVYIGRFCMSIIKQTQQSSAGRSAGIILLVIFCVLYLWMIWAYIKVVLTSPGFARDYIPKTAQPYFEVPNTRQSDFDLENTLSPYQPELENPKSQQEFDPTRTHRYNKPSYSSTSSHVPSHLNHRPPPTETIAGPSYENIVLRTSTHGRSLSSERDEQVTDSSARGPVSTPTVGEEDGGVGEGRLRTPFEPPFSIFVPEQEHSQPERNPGEDRRDAHTLEMGPLHGQGPPHVSILDDGSRKTNPGGPLLTASSHSKVPASENKSSWKLLLFPCAVCCGDRSTSRDTRGLPAVRRRLSTIPVLHPAHRYCGRDEIVKPFRAHHCRNCGTCVLKFDHHCPWIGQCVGARNHKFFLNFCQSAAVLTLYTLGTLVGFNVSAWTSEASSAHIDPQIIVTSALAALFALFTCVLTCSHIILMIKCQTTVESMGIHSTKEQESAALTSEYGWFAFGAKREARRQWNEEWGNLDTEGNIWWTGSRKRGWTDVMGKNPLGWILPIGRSEGDGVSYPVNPRFDEQGRLRRRAEWPAELR